MHPAQELVWRRASGGLVSTQEPVEAGETSPPDDPSLSDIADLALALGTDQEHGLGADEAAARLLKDGPNELRAVPPVSAWRRALAQLQDPLV